MVENRQMACDLADFIAKWPQNGDGKQAKMCPNRPKTDLNWTDFGPQNDESELPLYTSECIVRA